MGEKSSKKKTTISGICQNILMICGVITALTGALGGVVQTFKDIFNGEEKAAILPVGVASSPYRENSIGEGGEGVVLEQRLISPNGKKFHMSKSVDMYSEESEESEESVVVDDVVTMSASPEVTLGELWKRMWGWMFGIGITVVAIIISINIMKRKKYESTGS